MRVLELSWLMNNLVIFLEQRVAGTKSIIWLHHGVPLLVYKEQIFFGQDKFDDFKKLLIEDGLIS